MDLFSQVKMHGMMMAGSSCSVVADPCVWLLVVTTLDIS